MLDEEERYVGMISRRTLLNLRKKQLILVDHNELSQTVDGIDSAEILEIIDHHRIGTLETVSPVFLEINLWAVLRQLFIRCIWKKELKSLKILLV